MNGLGDQARLCRDVPSVRDGSATRAQVRRRCEPLRARAGAQARRCRPALRLRRRIAEAGAPCRSRRPLRTGIGPLPDLTRGASRDRERLERSKASPATRPRITIGPWRSSPISPTCAFASASRNCRSSTSTKPRSRAGAPPIANAWSSCATTSKSNDAPSAISPHAVGTSQPFYLPYQGQQRPRSAEHIRRARLPDHRRQIPHRADAAAAARRARRCGSASSAACSATTRSGS